MRIRLGLFGWALLGWIIIPCWIIYAVLKGTVQIFLALMSTLDKHNRRRTVRKAHQPTRLVRAVPVQPYRPWEPQRPEYPSWQPGEKPAWRPSEPQDNPYWQPHWPRRYR